MGRTGCPIVADACNGYAPTLRADCDKHAFRPAAFRLRSRRVFAASPGPSRRIVRELVAPQGLRQACEAGREPSSWGAAPGARWRRRRRKRRDDRCRRTAAEPTCASRAHRPQRRRDCDAPGDDEPRLRGRIAVPRADQTRGRSERSIRRRPRRGTRGNDGGVRTPASRLPSPGPRIQQPSWRPELDASRRRRLYRARRRGPGLRIRRGPLLQSRPVADPLPSPRDPRLLPKIWRRARALHPAQPQRLSAHRQGVRRQAAAHPRGEGRFRRRRVGASGQGRPKGRSRRRRLEGGPGDFARSAAKPRRPRQGVSLPRRRDLGGISRLRQGSRRGLGRGAGERRADRDFRTS